MQRSAEPDGNRTKQVGARNRESAAEYLATIPRNAAMMSLPRLAVGTIQPGADLRAILWALLDCLDREGSRVQCFRSRACPRPTDLESAITGSSTRHLDSWLMSPTACRAALARCARQSDMAIVEGEFGRPSCRPCRCGPGEATDNELGGSLETVCEWLSLPRLVVIDASRLADCRLPVDVPTADALLLDRVADARDFYRWQTILESLWGIPVVGGLEEEPHLRYELGQVDAGEHRARDLCSALGQSLRRFTDPQRILRVARRTPLAEAHSWNPPSPEPPARPGPVVAVAFDDAFRCYFPDLFDAFEAAGARVREFSPLRDEALPSETEIVYLGCGHPERFANQLQENQCLISALKSHICAGRRVYAEGGGLAYLSRSVQTGDQRLPMVGAIPINILAADRPARPEPVELVLGSDCWLGQCGDRIRGYLNPTWSVHETGCSLSLTDHLHGCALLARHEVVGSILHLNFGLQSDLLANLLAPQRAAPRPVALEAPYAGA